MICTAYPLASFPGHSPRRVAWYSLFAHARNIPGIYGIRKIPNIYRTLRPCTNRVCSFHVVDRQRWLFFSSSSTSDLFAKSVSYAVSKVGKAGIVLKPEQLQAVRHMYDVFLWLPTGFGKSICYEVLPFLFDCKLKNA